MPQPLDDIAAYLLGQNVESTLILQSVQKETLIDGRVYCHVLPPRSPAKPVSKSRLITSGKRPNAFLFLHSHNEVSYTGVGMELDNTAWKFCPMYGYIIPSEGFFIPMHQPWWEVLCRLAAKTLIPLLQFRKFPPHAAEAITKEVRVRVARFIVFGPFDFFARSGEAVAWLAATFWAGWEDRNVSSQARIAKLQRYVHDRIDPVVLQKVRPEAVAPQLRHGGLTLQQFLPKAGIFERLVDRNRDGRPPFWWWVHAYGTETMASDVSHISEYCNFDRISNEDAEKFFTKSRCWWWNGIKSQYTLLKFLNKWEASAYFYEYRARKLATSKMPNWDWFHTAWIDLDYTQKVIVYLLYHAHDEVVRPKYRSSMAKAKKSWIAHVDLHQPHEAVCSEVSRLWHELHNFSFLREGFDLGLESKWVLLERMDRNRFSGAQFEGFTKGESVILGREQTKYEKGCKNAGVTP